MRAEDPPGRGGRERGQTAIDFAIGIGVFLIVIAFVLTSVPNLMEPFDRNVQDDTVAADRIVDHLTEDLLAAPGQPFVLDMGCTFAFFNDETADATYSTGLDPSVGNPETVTECGYTDGPLSDRLGLANQNRINIRLVRDLTTGEADNPDADSDDTDDPGDPDDREANVLCYDYNSDRIIEGPSVSGNECDDITGDADLTFSIGDDPSDATSTAVARRTVEFEGGFADGTSDATLIVEVW